MKLKLLLQKPNKAFEKMNSLEILLNFFLNNVSKPFYGQTDIGEKLNEYYKKDRVRNQPAISKALKEMRDTAYVIGGIKYHIVYHNGCYTFQELSDFNEYAIDILIKKAPNIVVKAYNFKNYAIAYKTPKEYVEHLKTCISNLYHQGEIFDTICNNDKLYVILTPETPQINKIRDDLLNLQRIIDRKRKEAEKD